LIRLALALLLLAASLHAQQVGSQDLTRVAPQPGAGENVFPECPHGRVANTDGLMISKMRDKLALSIEDLSSRLIPIGSEFSATVRLKNISDHTVTIPWVPNFQDVIAGQPQDDWQFQTATFSFRIETGVEYKRTTELEGETVLYGSEDKPNTLLELATGQWATVRVRGVTKCRYKSQDATACPGLRPDSKARLTAEWSENGIAVQNSNCYIQRGNFAGPRADSHSEVVTLSKQ
jgi:hypothetical protein